MKVEINKKTGFPEYTLEKKDIADARAIRKMMDQRAFKILVDYWKAGRETLIDFGKNGMKGKDSKDLSASRWAVLFGYDECVMLVTRIIDRLDKFEEEKPDARRDDPNEEI